MVLRWWCPWLRKQAFCLTEIFSTFFPSSSERMEQRYKLLSWIITVYFHWLFPFSFISTWRDVEFLRLLFFSVIYKPVWTFFVNFEDPFVKLRRNSTYRYFNNLCQPFLPNKFAYHGGDIMIASLFMFTWIHILLLSDHIEELCPIVRARNHGGWQTVFLCHFIDSR